MTYDWLIVGRARSLNRWLFAIEQRVRRLSSLRRWSRGNGWPEIGARGTVPAAAFYAYRRRLRVVTPAFRPPRYRHRRRNR